MAVLLLLTLISVVRGDYDCLCSYDVERQVFQKPSNTSQVIGYLYEFDCKEIVRLKTESNTWNAIAYEQQIGYVLKNKLADIQICAGAAPQADKVTSPLPGGHTTESKKSSTVTTQTQTTTPTIITTEQKHTTSVSTQKPSTATTLLPTSFTTTIQTTTLTTETTTLTTTTDMTTPSTTTETTTPTTTTQKLTTTVTTSVPTTTRPSTTVPTTAEATRVCPKNLLEAAHLDDGIVIVDMAERKCYELIELHVSWDRAVDHCKRNGGQLATIKSSAQNELLHKYVLSYDQHRTWIGLNDYIRSGHFRWASGEPLSFTNWKENTAPLNAGRCIIMEPVSGKWEDENCIYSFPYICEFDISPNMPGVLVG